MDEVLWRYGESVARARNHPSNWELDFLRGMHQGPALVHLANALQVWTGHNIRLMSIWMDKQAWVSWTDANGNLVPKRELADLAVIIRKPHGNGLARWMWLIQGKRTANFLEDYSGPSSNHEIDLLHGMHQFTLLGSSKSFDLKRDFPYTGATNQCPAWGSAVSVPWTFMDFDLNITNSSSAYLSGYSPISPRWLGAPPDQGTWGANWQSANAAPDNSISSYTQCLCAIINGKPLAWTNPRMPGTSPAVFVPGGPIDQKNFPVWSDLYGSLLRMSSNATTKHAKTASNPNGSVLQTTQFAQRDFVQWIHRMTPWRDQYYGPYESNGVHFALSYLKPWNPNIFNSVASFDKRTINEQDFLSQNEPLTPEKTPENNDEPGGMLMLFVDVLSEAEVEQSFAHRK